MRAFFLALMTLILLPLAATAQSTDRPNTILVLDGSGSMWGQIDGVNKIVIAREVIAEMLADMADDVSLGLTVYGHRQRGSCTDIETIVAPGPGTQAQILEAVNSINPRGRTPMTDAVIAAAQSLRSTEEAATVILVSDGIENCNPDPCAIAAELEATGVDFTAHVIGFDVASEPEARAQMQCIADNTGGQFLTADNAAELSEALEQIVAAMPTPMRIEAQVLPQSTLPTRPVTWTLLGEDGAVISTGTPGPAIDVGLFPGTYIAQATRTEPTGPQTYQTSFTVIEGQIDLIVVAMPPIVETAQVTFTARVLPDMSVPASQLAWTLFDGADTTLLGPVVAPGGNVALLPGEYRLQVERANAGTRHETRFTVEPNTPQDVVIPLPALNVEVEFVARIGSVAGVTITDPVIWDVSPLNSNPATTNPATFEMSRGAYRVTAYWTAQEIEQTVDFVIVDQPREIIVVFPEPVSTATISGPAQAPMGSFIQVTWGGPANASDTLSFGQVGAPVTEYVNRVNITGATNPVQMLMPSEAGPFEIRYTDATTRQVIARVPILSTPVTATLQVPAEVTIGSAFDVTWTGPDYPNDFIVIAAPDAGTHGYTPGRRATADGPIAAMTAPTEAGTYEVRYRMGQDGVILARALINVVEEVASLTAPTTAVAGSTIELAWTGPGNDGDFISVTPVTGEGFHRIGNSVGTDEGSPTNLLMPSAPGDYVLEYVLAEGRTRVTSVPITVTPAAATLTAPTTAVAGATIDVGWTGPDYDNDFIAITLVDGEGYYRFANSTRTSEGTPLSLLMPPIPGSYIVEYVEGQDRTAITTVPITVTQPEASLIAPASAVAGSSLDIGWTGPDYSNDFIGITPVGDEGYYRFDQSTQTSEGNPLTLQMPTEPGEYVLEYVIGQDRVRLVSQPLTITELGATLTGPTSATAGSTVEIGWTGPGYDGDFIAVTPEGATGNYRFDQSTRVSEGNPVRLQMPTQPGAYVLEYALGQDRTALVILPITVTDLAATLTSPASAVAGSTIDIGWTGPGYDGDFIGVTPVGGEGNYRFINTTGVDTGNPIRLVMPPQPGAYLVEYALGQDRTRLTAVEITVTAPQATITAPSTAAAGASIEVAWTGPGYDSDFIGLTPVGAEGNHRFESTARVSEGQTLTMEMPGTPGRYVLEYVIGQGRLRLTSVEIEVTEQDASITAPVNAVAGSTIEIAWTGPNLERDYIGIGPVGAEDASRWTQYANTEDGPVLDLVMPITPGAYEITYFMRVDRVALTTVPITLTEVAATVTAPASAPAGSDAQIGWTGPDYEGDYIGIGAIGATGAGTYAQYVYTADGPTPLLRMPETPGRYLIGYFARQGRTLLGSVEIEVTGVAATVTAPATAIGGATIEVGWTGPNYDGDYIAIGRVGSTGSAAYETYSYTRDGSPLLIDVPDTAGEYVVRYFMRQGRTELASSPLTVQ